MKQKHRSLLTPGYRDRDPERYREGRLLDDVLAAALAFGSFVGFLVVLWFFLVMFTEVQ